MLPNNIKFKYIEFYLVKSFSIFSETTLQKSIKMIILSLVVIKDGTTQAERCYSEFKNISYRLRNNFGNFLEFS